MSFLSRLFSKSSSSSKRSSPHGSQMSINESSRYGGASSNMRSAASLDNLSSYNINPKELEKNKLHKASWEGNLNKVQRLAGPAQINVKDQQYRTPLHLAVVKGHIDIVKHLVHEGAKLDVVDNAQRTPLVKAVLSGSQNPKLTYPICVALLDGGADAFINAVDIYGKNALHYAIDFGHEGLVDLFLLVRNCDPNFRDREQMTPLHLAVQRSYANIVAILLSEEHEQQSDPNLINKNGQTPLHMAASAGNEDIVRILLQSNLDEPCDPTIVDIQQLTAFQIAQANHHEQCAVMIDAYQQGWTKLTPRRKASGSINEQAINQITMDPSQRFEDDQDRSSSHTSSNGTSPSSRSSSKPVNRPAVNQGSARTISSITTPKQETRSLADLIKGNPLQPDTTKTNTSKANNQTLTNLVNNIPLQPDEASMNKPQQRQPPSIFGVAPASFQRKETDHTSTSVSIEKSLINANPIAGQPSTVRKNVTINAIVDTIPQPQSIASNSNSWTHDTVSTHEQKQIVKATRVETSDDYSTTQSDDDDDDDRGIYRTKPPLTTFPKPQTFGTLNGTSVFTTTTATIPRKDSLDDSRSDEDSVEAAMFKLNTPKPSNGVQNLINKQIESNFNLPQQKSIPTAQSPRSDESSWSARSAPANKESTTKGISSLMQQQPLYNPKIADDSSWSIKSIPASKEPVTQGVGSLVQQQPLHNPEIADDSSWSTKSIPASKVPATQGVGSLVQQQPLHNQKIADDSSWSTRSIPASKVPATQGVGSLIQQQPLHNQKIADDSSWSTRSIPASKAPATQGVGSLIQQQPLHNQKMPDSILDDSRPLSADLKRTSINARSQTPSSSEDSDDNHNEKSATIIRSPHSGGVLNNIVQTNIRPTELIETKSKGVDNLTKIIDDIKHSSTMNPKASASPKTVSKLIASPLLQRNDSLSSNASSLLDDTVRKSIIPGTGTTNTKAHSYYDDIHDKHWSATPTTDRHDFDFLTRNHSNEMIQQSHRQVTRSSIHHDFNNLRGSMSSSTSSIQNNIDRLGELKEDIKQIERKQEDSAELKRQLKEMENKKNNFEALYKKNDQLLRETETKLEKEINEKQRLEWTTKNLSMELKSVKQKLESLEDEKDILNQRCIKLKEERDNYDEKLRLHQVNSLQNTAAGVLREEDIEKIKFRHREEMKLLSAENEDLHQRTKQLQSDLQLHKESLDVTIRYKIDLEKALEEKLYLQRELDRLKHEKDFIEQEKTDYKIKYDHLQDEIRTILLDRSRLEQKLTFELQEQTKQTQRSSDDSKKYKTQIEQLNMKLGDAEARLLVLQTQNEALIASKDREIKSEFNTLTHRLNIIESEKFNAEQRYHHERQEINNKQQQQPALHEPLVILTSTPVNHTVQHSPSSPCTKCDTLQRSFDQEREQRLQTQRDNERLRDTVSRQEQQQQQANKFSQQYQDNGHLNTENSQQIRSDTERVKYELDRLRHDFDKLVLNYEPPKNLQQQTQLYSQADALRQLYEQEVREKQLLLSKLHNETRSSPLPPPATTTNGYHRTSSSTHHHHHEYDHGQNGNSNCALCSNSRLLKERLENAIDTSLADQRIQTIKQIPILPRQTSSLLTTNTNGHSSVDILRKRYYV